MAFLKYVNMTCEDAMQEFSSSATQGLAHSQVTENKKKYGPNALIVPEKTWLDFLVVQYKSPIILLLLGVCGVSLVVGEYINFITVFCIVIINTGIGCYQEFMATKSAHLLGEYLEHESKVIRDGVEISIKSKELVPGDIVLLSVGDYIPADIRFIKTMNMLVDESRFSGESLPVEKTDAPLTQKIENVFRADNIGFSGTVVVEGAGTGIVFAIGKETFFGKASDLDVSSIHETKFFKNIKKISFFLMCTIAITLCALIALYILLKPSEISVVQILMFAIALSVGLVPEALPVITTFSLARGAMLLAEHSVIVKRLASIEDLGGIEILCADKTGTITENVLTVFDTHECGQEDPVFYMALSGSQVFEKTKRPLSPFDYAAWDKLRPADFETLATYKRIASLPFDVKNRRTVTVVEHNGQLMLIVRGDYEEIIKRSHVTDEKKSFLTEWIGKKAQEGCRVIAVSKKNITLPLNNNMWEHEHEMELVGVVALHDPIKESVTFTLQRAKELGLVVKIITGDGPAIAGHIAASVGIIDNVNAVITGDKFAALSDEQQEGAVHTYFVFSRFLPQQKAAVIQLLKRKYTVAFLGDGINDVAALKAADVGIAVNVANDIVKDAADIVLLKKSLRVLIDGVVIGRTIFSNIFTYLKTSLTSSIGNFYSIAVASLFLPFLPLLPLQILLINLFSDLPMIAISTDAVSAHEIVEPNKYNIKRLVLFMFFFGLISCLSDIVFFYYFYPDAESNFQTNWFMFSLCSEIVFIFSARTKVFFMTGTRPSMWLLFFAFFSAFLGIMVPSTYFGQMVFSFAAPQLSNICIMLLIVLSYFITTEVGKLFYYKYVVRALKNIIKDE